MMSHETRVTEMTREGRWGLSQEIDGQWQSTGTLGFATREEARRDVERLNSIQPGRFRIRDRKWKGEGQ